MVRRASLGTVFGLAFSFALAAVRPLAAAPLNIGYSDWPG